MGELKMLIENTQMKLSQYRSLYDIVVAENHFLRKVMVMYINLMVTKRFAINFVNKEIFNIEMNKTSQTDLP